MTQTVERTDGLHFLAKMKPLDSFEYTCSIESLNGTDPIRRIIPKDIYIHARTMVFEGE